MARDDARKQARKGARTAHASIVPEGTEVEIEFVSELGRVFVVRSGEEWHCDVSLAGQETPAETCIETDGGRETAYRCYEHLSHLLKHERVFWGIPDEPPAFLIPPNADGSPQKPPAAGSEDGGQADTAPPQPPRSGQDSA